MVDRASPTKRARAFGVIAIAGGVALWLGGCAVSCPCGARLTSGMDERDVRRELGDPQVVQDQAGDLARVYAFGQNPEYVWRLESQRYVYLERGCAVVFRSGRVSGCEPIDPEMNMRFQSALQRGGGSTP